MDPLSFKQGMRFLCGGVTIVTSKSGDMASGLTATAVCSLSAEPPRLLACINQAGATYRVIAQSRVFCVNVLAMHQMNLARRFAGLGQPGDRRFAEDCWTSLATGAPALDGCLASFDCVVSSVLDSGSHAVIIGDVKEVRSRSGDLPLLYMDGRFMTAAAVEEALRSANAAP